MAEHVTIQVCPQVGDHILLVFERGVPGDHGHYLCIHWAYDFRGFNRHRGEVNNIALCTWRNETWHYPLGSRQLYAVVERLVEPYLFLGVPIPDTPTRFELTDDEQKLLDMLRKGW